MIILQIIAGIFLVPFTALIIILFNLYLIHWTYLLFILFLALLYSALWGLVFFTSGAAVWAFMILAILYIIRMRRLAARMHAKNNDKNYPLICGKISSKKDKVKVTFLFPLSFLKVLKLLPSIISKKTVLSIEMHKLVDLIAIYSKGTLIDVTSDEVDVYIEVK